MAIVEREVQKTGLSANRFHYLGWDDDADPGDLWRSEGLRKMPIPELVYEHGDGLGVGGMLLLWFEHFGSGTCRIDYDIYLFDVLLKKLYKSRTSERTLGSVTGELAARLLKERDLAQSSR